MERGKGSAAATGEGAIAVQLVVRRRAGGRGVGGHCSGTGQRKGRQGASLACIGKSAVSGDMPTVKMAICASCSAATHLSRSHVQLVGKLLARGVEGVVRGQQRPP